MPNDKDTYYIFNPQTGLFWNNKSGWGACDSPNTWATEFSAEDTKKFVLPLHGEWIEAKEFHELLQGAELYNDLTDAADGGGAISVDELQASTLIAMLQSREYCDRVRLVWDAKFA
jgi:hypothetical protein